MFKKFLSFIFVVVVSIGFFAGCSLININTAGYYNSVVAEVVFNDHEKQYTMKDLLNAYNSFGSQYVQNGMSVEEAVSNTLTTMIDRDILIQELRKIVVLSEPEKEELKRETYKSINETITEIENEIRKGFDLEFAEDEEKEEETKISLRDEYAEFTAVFEVSENGLVRISEKPNLDQTLAGDFVQNITDQNVSTEAYKRYLSQLRQAAEIENKKDQTDQELLADEIKRIYDILEDNKILEKYSSEYVTNSPVDTTAVETRYKELVLRDYYQYSNNLKAYHSAMRSDSSNVYYHPQNNAYLNVTHILVKLSPEQNIEISNLQKQLKANTITKEIYEYKLNQVKSKTVVKYNDEKNNVLTKSINSVYDEVYNAVNQYSKNALELRAKAFNEYIYKYNDDTGIMNKETAYVVNLTEEEGFSDIMIKEFTEASRNLHTDPNLGTGAVSELVFAEFADGEFGFHIIMNLGVVENLVEKHNVNDITWQALFNKKTQPSSNKSVFDVVYESLKLDESKADIRMDEIVKTAKGNIIKIKLYENVYKSLLQ